MNNRLTLSNYTINDSEIYGGVHYISQCNEDGDLTVGSVMAASIEFTTTYSSWSLNQQITYSIKQRSDSAYRQIGIFYVTEIDYDNHGRYTITALDAISKLDKDVEVESGTLFTVMSSALSQCNVQADFTSGWVNGTYICDVPDSVIFTGRQIVKYIAELNGAYAYVNSNGLLCLGQYEYQEHRIDNTKYVSNDYSTYGCPEIWVVRFSQDKDDIGISSGNPEFGAELRVYGNQLIDYSTLEASQAAVDNVLSVVEYEEYHAGEIDLLEDYGINCGEIIGVDDFAFFVMKKEITQSGVKLYSYGNSQRNVEAVMGNSDINNLKGKYNTLNRTVEETVSEVGELGTTVNGHTTSITTLTQRADGMDITVSQKVGNNEIISKINQSAEQITIQANKLNLTGMATFSQLEAVEDKADAAQATADGSIASVDVEYYKSTSHTTTTGGSWSTTAPVWEEGYYIWSRNKNTLNDGTITYSTASCITGNTGSQGTSTYTHIRYSEYSDGTNFVTTPTSSTKYIGVYTGTSQSAPTTKESYVWSKYMGDDGVDGNGINNIHYYYKATSTQTQPQASAITSTSIPAMDPVTNKYLWQKQVIDFTDPLVQDQTIISLLGAYGSNGTNGTSVSISSTEIKYATSTSGTTVPTSGWQTTVPTVQNGRYLWTRTIVNYSPSGSTTSYAVAYKGTNGTNGTGITSITELYYVSSSSSAPSKPTSHVTTSSTTAYNQWNKMCSTYNASYPYYYTCSEILYTTGSYGWSDVVSNKGYESSNSTAASADSKATDAKSKTDGLATGTTVINGGCITTGIIQSSDANHQYYVNLDTGAATLKSATITGGTININTGSTTPDIIALNYSEGSSKLSPARLVVNNTNNGYTTQYEGGGFFTYQTDTTSGTKYAISLTAPTISTTNTSRLSLYDGNGAKVAILDGTYGLFFYGNNANEIWGKTPPCGQDRELLLANTTSSSWTYGYVIIDTEIKRFRGFQLVCCSNGGGRVLASTYIPNTSSYWLEQSSTPSASVMSGSCSYAVMAGNTSYTANCYMFRNTSNGYYYIYVKKGNNGDAQCQVWGLY